MKRAAGLIVAIFLLAGTPALTAMAKQQYQPPQPTMLSAASEAPRPRGPGDGTIVSTMDRVTLSWDLAAIAEQYQVQVIPYNGDGPGINLVIGDRAMVVSQSYVIAPPRLGEGNYIMLPGASYTWRVRATASSEPISELDGAWSDWSPVMTFKTLPPTSATIALHSQANGNVATSATPTMEWTDSNVSAFYYEVQLSRDRTFNLDSRTATEFVYWNLVHGGESSPLNSWTVPGNFPLVSGTYYWRVRPRVQATFNGTEEGGVAWSASGSFSKP